MRCVPSSAATSVADTGFPPRHVSSTSTPPRARRPLTRPSAQAFGSAGSRLISPAWLCEQHLGDPRRPAEVAIDLERRVRIEQVRERGLPKQRQHVLVRELGFLQPRPEVDDPRAAPAGMTPAVGQPPLQRFLGRRRQFRRAVQRDLVARVQRIELRHVPVAGLHFLEVLRPFLDLPVLADLERRQPRPRLRHLLPEFRINAQNLPRADQVVEQVMDDLLGSSPARYPRPRCPRPAS